MSRVPTPDFNTIADEFDRFLPLIHPVSLALLDRLPEPTDGATVLDVACGTGEPGLTLLRRWPRVYLLGIDSAAAMLEVARRKAAQEGLANARFALMPSESLDLPSESVDGVVSRFGLLMFGDVPAAARELARVLRGGGGFSIAVWDDMRKNTLNHAASLALRRHLPEDHVSPIERLQEWAAEGRRARLLEEVGLRDVQSEMISWTYHFDDFEQAWDLMCRMGRFSGQATLSEEAQAQVKQDLAGALAPYREEGGTYAIPHACRILWGRK
jgi:SAM-dependent methyltransferase